MSAQANIIKSTSVATASQATVVATVKRIAKANAQLQVIASLTCQAKKQTEIAIVVNGFANLTVIGQTARLAIVLTGSQATLTLTANRTRNLVSAQTAQAQVTARLSYTVRPTIGLNTQTQLQATVGAIHIDPYLTWKILNENRLQTIRQETGVFKIGRDNRLYKIRKEVRNYRVRQETRIHTIRR